MKYAVYTTDGLAFNTPYGVYHTEERAVEARNWLISLGHMAYIKPIEQTT